AEIKEKLGGHQKWYVAQPTWIPEPTLTIRPTSPGLPRFSSRSIFQALASDEVYRFFPFEYGQTIRFAGSPRTLAVRHTNSGEMSGGRTTAISERLSPTRFSSRSTASRMHSRQASSKFGWRSYERVVAPPITAECETNLRRWPVSE